MGRYSTGATSTNANKRISISFLKQQGYFEPGQKTYGTCNFNINGEPTGSISIMVNTIEEPYLQLAYTQTDHTTGEKTDIDYKVKLVRVKSNLGKGYRYYFLCPFSLKQCEIIYMAYGSLYFKHRKAYKHQIYYPQQMESKMGRCFRYHSIERQIEEMYLGKKKSHYRGRKTRRMKRIELLEKKFYHYSGLADELLIASFAKRGY